jgi:hypothetical protein
MGFCDHIIVVVALNPFCRRPVVQPMDGGSAGFASILSL